MPLFNFFEWWDSYLSAALYSGNEPSARVYISQEVYDRLRPEVTTAYATLRVDATSDDPCPYEVDFFRWAMEEMNVPYYPAERVWRGLARRLAELSEKTAATSLGNAAPREERPSVRVILILRGRADWRTGERQEKRVVFPE